jgi:hypothetical protein
LTTQTSCVAAFAPRCSVKGWPVIEVASAVSVTITTSPDSGPTATR